LRILLVVDTFPSVSETFISNKVRLLSERGHLVIVFCVKRNDGLFRSLFNNNARVKIVLVNIQKLILFLISHPLSCINSLIRDKKEFRQSVFKKFRLSLIEKQRPDVIHFEFSGIGIDYLFEIERLRCKTVVSCRGTAEKVKLLIYDERKEKFKQLLKRVGAVHCVSKDMLDTIMPYCSQPEKVFINFPSIDPILFQRKENKTSSSPKLILSVGRLTFQKGYTTALLAIKLLKEAGVSFKWIIVGYGNKYEELIFKIHQFHLEHEVMLMGLKTRDEVQYLMEDADIFFLPSVYEGIANVVLEAMAMRLPVVATKSGGMCEVIDHKKNGLLTEIYDYESMAKNLLKLCADPLLCNYLGSNARKKVKEHFDIQRQVAKFERVYEALQFDSFPQQKKCETTVA
jgi:colanic acid/amylovoran biosynthesis glycosyltransferase